MRIFNTWMGDQSKLLLLKEVVKVIQEEGLLHKVKEAGQVLLIGLEIIQVLSLISFVGLIFMLVLSPANWKDRSDASIIAVHVPLVN